jgi:cell division septation protein DedD
MSDQGFHEIQLTGKQLVFLFMAAVVLAVSIFLLGVSVGRGVRSSAATAADLGAPSDTTASASTPPSNVKPADLDYHQKLQSTPSTGAAGAAVVGAAAGAAGATASAETKPVEPPQPPPELPADSGKKNDLSAMAGDPNAAKATPKSTPTPAKPTPTPAKPAATPTPTPAAAASTSTSKQTPPAAESGWIVQLNAFGTKGAAESFIKELKGKGYTAYSVQSATLFKVRVGPFANKADADKMANRLKKDGYTPLVSR